MTGESAPSPGGQRWVIRRNRPLRLLLISRTISLTGSAVGLVALLLQLATTGSGIAAVTILMICADLLPALPAPLVGVVADRVDLRRLMVICEFGQAVLTALMAWWVNLVPLVLFLFTVRALLGQIFQPSSRASVPTLVSDTEMPAANAALGFGEHGLPVFGPVLAALLVPALHIRGLLLVDAASFLVSALVLTGLPRIPAQVLEVEGTGTFLRHAGAGLRYLWRSVGLRLVLIGFGLVVAFNGVDDIALVFFAKGPLSASPSAVSLLYAGAAAGLLIGFGALGRWGSVLVAPALLTAGYAVSSLGNLLTGVAGTVLLALLLQAVRGLGLAAMNVGVTTVIQRTVPGRLQGRTFANFYGFIGLAAGASYLLGGLLLYTVGPRLTFVIAGAGGVLVAAVLFALFGSRLPPGESAELSP